MRGRKKTAEGAKRIKDGKTQIAERTKAGKIKWVNLPDPQPEPQPEQQPDPQPEPQPEPQPDRQPEPQPEGLNIGKLGGESDNYEDELRAIFEANKEQESDPDIGNESLRDNDNAENDGGGTTFEPEVLVLTSELSISFVCSMLIKRSEMKDFYFKPEQKESLLKAAAGLDIQVQLSPVWQYVLALATVTGANVMEVMKKQKADMAKERENRENQQTNDEENESR